MQININYILISNKISSSKKNYISNIDVGYKIKPFSRTPPDTAACFSETKWIYFLTEHKELFTKI